jgi:hypothetical protein
MSKNNGILREQAKSEATPFLFSPETIASLTAAERQGEYTLERLRELRPEVIDEVIRLRGQFIGQLRIAKLLKLHHRTIAAIDRAYPERIQVERRNRVARLQSAADKLIELVDEAPESVPASYRCLAATQLYDKAQLLSGGATANVAIDLRKIDLVTPYQKFVELFEEIARLKRAGTIDIETSNELIEKSFEALERHTGLGRETGPTISEQAGGV